jgi:hypothetical protein
MLQPGWWLSPTPQKNMSSSDWIIIPNLVGENKTCSKKKPTSDGIKLDLSSNQGDRMRIEGIIGTILGL